MRMAKTMPAPAVAKIPPKIDSPIVQPNARCIRKQQDAPILTQPHDGTTRKPKIDLTLSLSRSLDGDDTTARGSAGASCVRCARSHDVDCSHCSRRVPAAIPATVGIVIGQEDFLLSYFLAAAELGIAVISIGASRLADATAIGLIAAGLAVFHLSTAALEIFYL